MTGISKHAVSLWLDLECNLNLSILASLHQWTVEVGLSSNQRQRDVPDMCKSQTRDAQTTAGNNAVSNW